MNRLLDSETGIRVDRHLRLSAGSRETDVKSQTKRAIKTCMPPFLFEETRRVVYAARSLFFRGNTVFCVCCNGHFRRFFPYGERKRAGAQCPRCGSLERHRLLWLYLRDRTELWTDQLRLLHIAPEACFQKAFVGLPNLDYLTADLNSRSVMANFDVAHIPYPDEHFDVIICNHVLEHVKDDWQAMRELRRVCKRGGWAILQVPVDPDRAHTFEDPTIVSPGDRERSFGQFDHVRSYGRDYVERLRACGWVVQPERYADSLEPRLVPRYGLTAGFDQDIYFCANSAEPVDSASTEAIAITHTNGKRIDYEDGGSILAHPRRSTRESPRV